MSRLASHPVSGPVPFHMRALHGLTATRAAVGMLMLFAFLLCSIPMIRQFRSGLPLGTILVNMGLIFLGGTAWVVPTVVLGLFVYNLGRGSRTLVRYVLVVIVVAAGSACWPATFWIDAAAHVGIPRQNYIWAMWLRHFVLTGLMLGTLILVTRDEDAAQLLSAEELRDVEQDRAHKAARLQVAQAQIEPHFLFNALANVKRLYQLDQVAGRTMLRNLSHVLGSALSQMRDDRSTVARELELALAYLRVQQIRMGERLTVETRVPASLRAALLPSMMLSTLVENAIKHGIGPLTEGGTVCIEADAEGAHLQVRVIDSGRGLVPGGGTGVGLANIESRLEAQFGRDGQLTLEERPSGGTVAMIAIPLQMADSEALGHDRVLA